MRSVWTHVSKAKPGSALDHYVVNETYSVVPGVKSIASYSHLSSFTASTSKPSRNVSTPEKDGYLVLFFGLARIHHLQPDLTTITVASPSGSICQGLCAPAVETRAHCTAALGKRSVRLQSLRPLVCLHAQRSLDNASVGRTPPSIGRSRALRLFPSRKPWSRTSLRVALHNRLFRFPFFASTERSYGSY